MGFSALSTDKVDAVTAPSIKMFSAGQWGVPGIVFVLGFILGAGLIVYLVWASFQEPKPVKREPPVSGNRVTPPVRPSIRQPVPRKPQPKQPMRTGQ